MAKCDCDKKTTHDMDREEFIRWAAEVVTDGLLTGGLREMQRELRTVINQQSMIYTRNGGFQPEAN